MLIVLTGPGSSGKDTIQSKLLGRYPRVQRLVTTTSRPKRESETDGKDYNFIGRDEFLKRIQEGDFLEYVEFGGNFYGTTKDAFKPVLEGYDVVWRIEMSRAGGLKEFFTESFTPDTAEKLLKNTLIIYIDVPNWNILKERMKARGDSNEEIEKRIAQDKSDFETYGGSFKHIVMNHPEKLDETIDKIDAILENHAPHSLHQFVRAVS